MSITVLGRNRYFATACGLALMIAGEARAQIVITDNTSASDLVNAILGAGVHLAGTPSLIGNSDENGAQQGQFTATSGIIGFNSGIVLTSGYAHNVVGPNDVDNITKAWSAAGDSDLSTLSGFPTHDANVLEFQFTVDPEVHSLSIRYAFGSDEYNEFVDSDYNDVFGFYVDGVNVATLPVAGSPPVSVNTVNSGLNPAYFRENILPGSLIDTELDGLTIVLTADVFAALNPELAVHTMKLAIGDSTDDVLDSAVFIQAQSFEVPEPGSMSIIACCMLGLVKRRR